MGAGETNDHEFNHVRKRSGGERDDGGPTNCSFDVGGSVYVVGNDGTGAGCQVEDLFW